MKMHELVVDMARTVREHVAASVGPLLARIDALEAREKKQAATIRRLKRELAALDQAAVKRNSRGQFQ